MLRALPEADREQRCASAQSATRALESSLHTVAQQNFCPALQGDAILPHQLELLYECTLSSKRSLVMSYLDDGVRAR